MPVFVRASSRAKAYYRGTKRGSSATFQKQSNLLGKISRRFHVEGLSSSRLSFGQLKRQTSLQKRYFRVQTFGSKYSITAK